MDNHPSSDEEPLSTGTARRKRRPAGGLRVALLYNAKEHAPKVSGGPADKYDELDSLDNVAAYKAALESAGHTVFPLEGNPDLPRELARRRVDICFNTCEGHQGDSREAQVPALLEMLGMPYTAGRVMALAITLDKAMTKRVLAFHGLPTPRFQEFNRVDQPLDPTLRFPLFTKPNREGTAIGISNKSLVHDEAGLRARLAYLLEGYQGTVLVEEYVDGRDVTCGLVGNLTDPNLPTPPGGIPSSDGHPGGAADWNGLHLFPMSEVDHTSYEAGRAPIYSNRLKVDMADSYHFFCPAEVPEAIGNEIRRLTVETFRVTSSLDLSRVDFRLDVNDNLRPQIIEINALPGITPISDLTLCAQAENWSYERLINAVMDAAVQRFGLETLRQTAAAGRQARTAVRKSKLELAAASA